MTSPLDRSKITSLRPLSISSALFSSMFRTASFSCIFLLSISAISALNTSLRESDSGEILARFESSSGASWDE